MVSGSRRRSAVVLEKLPIGFGQALKEHRAGLQNIVYHRLLGERRVARIGVHSSAFGNMEPIPVRYTADGEGLSPPLEWYGIPDGAAAIAVVVEDGDAPTTQPLVHAIAVNLDSDRRILSERALMIGDDDLPADIDLGLNSMLKRGWLPPDPPPGHGEHRYAFQVFALSSGPVLPSGVGRHEVLEAILKRALAAGCLLGTYERPHRAANEAGAGDDNAKAGVPELRPAID
jgi:Raf kinase inhibitor-like YbhB/YbcL family protein